jgi:riboflavin biosynthesis pyrimidine reductase
MGAPRSPLAIGWSDRLRAVYGADVGAAAGVVHVAAVAAAADGRLLVIAPGPDAPTSATDAFVLEAARARVDAIVTTGEILRRERDLSHALSPPARAWRREVLGRDGPPLVAVLTRRPDEAARHPALARREGCVLLTPETRANPASRGGVRVYAGRSESLAEAVLLLAGELGAGSLLIEAGPRTARELYGTPVLVDELLLSVCEGATLAPPTVVGEFASASRIAAVFGEPVHASVEEDGGLRWRFLRYLRRR